MASKLPNIIALADNRLNIGTPDSDITSRSESANSAASARGLGWLHASAQ
jgi:hypothetical protein